MEDNKMLDYVKNVLENAPTDWLKLTTHRLDIYDEQLAKTQFLEHFEQLFSTNDYSPSSLKELPTAFDYIRLGHPLSCLFEWVVAKLNNREANNVICFSSKTVPALSILRKNLLENKLTQICYKDALPEAFDADLIRRVYGYNFELKQIKSIDEIEAFEGSTVFISKHDKLYDLELDPKIDFFISLHPYLGSVLVVNGEQNVEYISEIQHVRRRETISMTPANCQTALELLLGLSSQSAELNDPESDQALVQQSINQITGTQTKALVGSSGLSIQYAIMMGLVDHALDKHIGKDIKIIVPPNCYGGTNDQARRVAACRDNVEVVDLPVDGGQDMVKSIDLVLGEIAKQDAVPYIIAEIPTNPRVEVPDLEELRNVLSKERQTLDGTTAVDPVFILDQTFCPNVHFLGDDDILADIRTISYVSGSKFPSGGLCTAGYCVANKKSGALMERIEAHLRLCDNVATNLQFELLAKQLPSMETRIFNAYKNTREFANFISEVLPEAKINFVSEELAKAGFTPSVFSLDLPSQGNTEEEKEANKRELNLKLIGMMIQQIPDESKFCVSYGQLKGCYWTIPATSTQGTTKEGDKDYIVRVALSSNMDLELHKKVFQTFVDGISSN